MERSFVSKRAKKTSIKLRRRDWQDYKKSATVRRRRYSKMSSASDNARGRRMRCLVRMVPAVAGRMTTGVWEGQGDIGNLKAAVPTESIICIEQWSNVSI